MAVGTYIKLKFDVLRSIIYSSTTTSYKLVGNQFNYPVRSIKIDNSTNAGFFISFDGINNHIYMLPTSYLILDYGYNASYQGGVAENPAYGFYVKRSSTNPTSGSLYCSLIYLTNA